MYISAHESSLEETTFDIVFRHVLVMSQHLRSSNLKANEAAQVAILVSQLQVYCLIIVFKRLQMLMRNVIRLSPQRPFNHPPQTYSKRSQSHPTKYHLAQDRDGSVLIRVS